MAVEPTRGLSSCPLPVSPHTCCPSQPREQPIPLSGPASPFLLSLLGEPRGAALVSLLQPLCQLHHREHHQSPEPQSHGYRGHIRCWGSPQQRVGKGVSGDVELTLDMEGGICVMALVLGSHTPVSVPNSSTKTHWDPLWDPLTVILDSVLHRIRKIGNIV